MRELDKVYGDEFYMDLTSGVVYKLLDSNKAVEVASVRTDGENVDVSVFSQIPAIVISKVVGIANKYNRAWESINANSRQLC